MNKFLHKYGVPNEHFNSNSTEDIFDNVNTSHKQVLDSRNIVRDNRKLADSWDELKPHEVDRLANSSDKITRDKLTQRLELQPHHIDKLLGGTYINGFVTLARSKNLKPHHIDKLLDVDIGDRTVHRALAYNPSLQSTNIDKLIEKGSRGVHDGLKERKDLSPEQRARLK